MHRGRGVLALLTVLGGIAWSGWSIQATAEERPPVDVAELMDILAESGGIRARFHEMRLLSILTDPVESSGILYFAPPDRLARYVTRPGLSRVVVQAGRISVADETGRRELDLRSSEAAQALVGNLTTVLRGDIGSLKARYELTFRSDASSWALELEPRSPTLRSIVERIRFSGPARTIARVETSETNGDRTILTMSDIETGLSWSTSELERIFALVPPDDTR